MWFTSQLTVQVLLNRCVFQQVYQLSWMLSVQSALHSTAVPVHISRQLYRNQTCSCTVNSLSQPTTELNWKLPDRTYSQNHSIETAFLYTHDNVYHIWYRQIHCSGLIGPQLSLCYNWSYYTHKLSQETCSVTETVLNRITSYIPLLADCQTRQEPHISITMQVQCSQVSVHGSLLFAVCISPISSKSSLTGVCQHQYADNTQLYLVISNPTASADLSILESALSILSIWFSHNWLNYTKSWKNQIDYSWVHVNAINHSVTHIVCQMSLGQLFSWLIMFNFLASLLTILSPSTNMSAWFHCLASSTLRLFRTFSPALTHKLLPPLLIPLPILDLITPTQF